MTSIRIKTALSAGIHSEVVSIEANFVRGFSAVTLIGSQSDICRGGLLRAQAALEKQGFTLPQKRIIVSLFPADQKKEGNQFDLAFAISLFTLLQEPHKIRSDLEKWLFIAELGLDGTLQGVKGIINYALIAYQQKFKGIIISKENTDELKELSNLENISTSGFSILSCSHLQELLPWLQTDSSKNAKIDLQVYPENKNKKELSIVPNFDDMQMSPELKEIACVVSCGHHNLFMTGSPGTGKSMFSERLPSLMTELEEKEKIEAFQIYSCFAGKVDKKILHSVAPFRAPHHTASTSAILGSEFNPGEISLAHGGLLFLDEFPEFRKDVIEALREPLETGLIRISRSRHKIQWASKFVLIVAANTCPCGWLGSHQRRCLCPTNKIMAYKRKLSGPILDRIDIHIHMDQLMVHKDEFLRSLGSQENQTKNQTKLLKQRVLIGKTFACKRNSRWNICYNRDLKAQNMAEAFSLGEKKFREMIEQKSLQRLTNRGLLKILKVARTLADLDESIIVKELHLKKALNWTEQSLAKVRGDTAFGLS